MPKQQHPYKLTFSFRPRLEVFVSRPLRTLTICFCSDGKNMALAVTLEKKGIIAVKAIIIISEQKQTSPSGCKGHFAHLFVYRCLRRGGSLKKNGGTLETYLGLECRSLQGEHYEPNVRTRSYVKAITTLRNT